MRVTKEKAAANRARVVEEAARLFRDHGVDGVGVADVMKQAGLTHGGFYNHFTSKETLAAEAITLAFEQAIARLEKKAIETAPRARALEAYVARYLAPEYRDAPGPACPMAALGTEAARQGPPVREAFSAGTARYLETFAALMPGPCGDAAEELDRRAAAIATMSMLIGALTLARAVTDRGLSDEILATVAKTLTPQASVAR
jgi:TetR/AcrR family transcriptional repressor of nem operon